MTRTTALGLATAAVLALWVSNATATVRGQAPCATLPCTTFIGWNGPSSTMPRTLRAFTFTLPAAATVLVSFHGYMHCTEDQNEAGGFSLESQIVPVATDAPRFFFPGGLIHRWEFPVSGAGSDSQQAFSLVSSRNLTYATGGVKTVYFRIGRGFQSKHTECKVWNAAFTVVY